ncbi:hypothetical protein [Orenia marismortui]|nr:hypothetical protein [Orenia marismortui]
MLISVFLVILIFRTKPGDISFKVQSSILILYTFYLVSKEVSKSTPLPESQFKIGWRIFLLIAIMQTIVLFLRRVIGLNL